MAFFRVVLLQVFGDDYVELVGYVAFWVVQELVCECEVLCFAE